MVQVIKKEWHQVSREFTLDLDTGLLGEIYPDSSEEELEEMLAEVGDGTRDIEDVMADAWDSGVDMEWNHEYDDWWTDRKGGYDVTYELAEGE
jgi:hypothetical protein